MSAWNIIWHSRDLRVEDNPALNQAASGNVLPIYIHCPEEEGKWSSGAATDWWLHHSLKELSQRYEELGTRLVIRSGPAMQVLEELANEVPIQSVFWNHHYEPAVKKRDQQIAKKLGANGVHVECFEGNYLLTPQELLNKSGKPYSVFTPFSKAFLEFHSWRKPLPAPKINQKHSVKSDAIETLNLLPKLDWADPFSEIWQAGRKGALKVLREFSEVIEHYNEDRDIPSILGTSCLSPYLHFGEISPHEIWKTFAARQDKCLPFLRQLIWREFSNYFLFHSPTSTDLSWKKNFEKFPWEKNPEGLKAWKKGMTGYPIVDAGMRQLWKTGWMHNRVRMIVGSFLVKDLFIHWTEGARWFWDTLLDADLANNTMGWQWVAGTGADAAPYFRIFNPVLQGKKFDPEGDYIRRWVPELKKVPSKWIHNPWEAPEPPLDYPAPIVDHSDARKKALAAYHKLNQS
ncbi:MAG: deoxyribodipyrimidine photolyase [Waddliaceae bacterium]|nr:deoxyribodipyrimidine photolyase [Waddliaceae bacterium]